jgi:uncharacterized membrane protein
VQIELTPRCALTPRAARLFYSSLCAVCFGVATFWTVLGYWPVLPFAGLEMLALGWALKLSMDRRKHRQTITLTPAEVAIESAFEREVRQVVFPRYWAQVRIRAGLSPLHPSRLTIESHGRRCEVGSFLNEQERLGLAHRLRGLVGRRWTDSVGAASS